MVDLCDGGRDRQLLTGNGRFATESVRRRVAAALVRARIRWSRIPEEYEAQGSDEVRNVDLAVIVRVS